jgi:hypothetical protein
MPLVAGLGLLNPRGAFLSGSSARMLSQELATCMRGRYMEALVFAFLANAQSILAAYPGRLPGLCQCSGLRPFSKPKPLAWAMQTAGRSARYCSQRFCLWDTKGGSPWLKRVLLHMMCARRERHGASKSWTAPRPDA